MKALTGDNVRNAVENEFPFVVSLAEIVCNNTNIIRIKHKCSGSLITRADIITSAHCLTEEIRNAMRIIFGANDYRLGQRRVIQWWLTYEQWAMMNNVRVEFDQNDIANIRIIERIPEAIARVVISNTPNTRLYGKIVSTAGWSVLNATLISTLLKTVELKIIVTRDCLRRISAIMRQRVTIDNRQAFCTEGEPHAILNNGDSGAPLLYRNKMIAINKGTTPSNLPEGDLNKLNIHVTTHYYRKFIKGVMDHSCI